MFCSNSSEPHKRIFSAGGRPHTLPLYTLSRWLCGPALHAWSLCLLESPRLLCSTPQANIPSGSHRGSVPGHTHSVAVKCMVWSADCLPSAQLCHWGLLWACVLSCPALQQGHACPGVALLCHRLSSILPSIPSILPLALLQQSWPPV